MYQGFAYDFAMVAAAPKPFETSVCAIKQPPASAITSEGGQAALADYTTVSGLGAIPCMDAPDNFGSSLSASEQKGEDVTASMAKRHVYLDTYYSQLSPTTNWGDKGWIAVITGPSGDVLTYDLIGAEADSQQTQTRLCLRKVTL